MAHLKLKSAAGITKAINLTTNVTALVVFLLHGQVLLVLGLVAGAFNIVGNYLGSHSFSKNGGAVARPITIVVLVIFFAKVYLGFRRLSRETACRWGAGWFHVKHHLKIQGA